MKLPKVDFYQLYVEGTFVTEDSSDPKTKIADFETKNHFDTAVVVERELSLEEIRNKKILDHIAGEQADFDLWIFTIARESMGDVSKKDLYQFEDNLKSIFNAITYGKDRHRVFNNLFRQDEIRTRIRLAFHKHRELNIKSEVIPQSASLLLVEKLTPVEEHDKLYPSSAEVKDILQADATGKDILSLQKEVEEAHGKLKAFIESQKDPDLFSVAAAGMGLNMNAVKQFSKAVVSKDKTFQCLPYSFSQSRFELKFLQEALTLSSFIENKLEIYYNGEAKMTEFRIVCYSKKNDRWLKVGKYTPDFLVVKRESDKIHKILIVETKGRGFAEQTSFTDRRHFVETEFLRMNNNKFGYSRFDYLYLEDKQKMDETLLLFKTKIEAFFKES